MLRSLMEAVYRIGAKVFPESPLRLFAHQIGDGFIIVSEFGAVCLEDPIAIAIALVRQVAESGCVAKAAVAVGDLADIQGCYPDVVRNAPIDDGRVRMGRGLMTTFTVMGTALIRAVGISKKVSGGLLLTHKTIRGCLPRALVLEEIPETDLVSVDWVHSTVPRVSEIQRQAGLDAPTTRELEEAIRAYLESQEASATWKQNTKRFLGL